MKKSGASNEAKNNPNCQFACIGHSVYINHLRPVEAGGGDMTKDTALDLALEALESCGAGHITDGGNQWHDEKLVDKAITAIKQSRALDKKAENARELGLDYEPVFCEYCGGNDDADFGLPTDHCTDCARPQPAAQRQWTGLTDEEIESLDCVYLNWLDYEEVEIKGEKEFAQAIEAKLKEKNNG